MIPIVPNISRAVTYQVTKRFRQHLLVKGVFFFNGVRIDTYTWGKLASSLTNEQILHVHSGSPALRTPSH